MRKFEIISEEQWNKDIGDAGSRENHLKPHRSTKYSAGYDFISPVEMIVRGHGTAKIPTGIKVKMEDDEVLMIYPRSSIGFKTNIRLSNSTGIIDSDYYNNPDNEGHILIKFFNPTDDDYQINIGDKIAQGIFTKYLIVEDEEDVDIKRAGGIGSTGN